MKKSPKKIIKNTAKVMAVLGGLVLGGYHFSEKIGYIQHDVQKELKDSLGKKEILKDQETNDIIELMSGKISQEHFDAMLARHGYINDTIKINTLIQPDEALYKTILEMQTKYTNPKISFKGSFRNYETWGNEPDRSRFNPVTNTIKSHQLDSVMIKFDNIKNKEDFRLMHIPGLGGFSGNTRQKYLLNNWIAELAHAKQLKERGLIKMGVDCAIDYIQSGFDYDKTYYMPGTTEEYQAHEIYEPELIKEFIKIYEKYANKESSGSCLWNIIKFNSGFFTKFKDENKAYRDMKTLEQRGNAQANYILARSYFELYTENFVIGGGHSISTNDTITQIILGKKYTAQTFFQEVLSHYQKAYTLGNINAGCDLVQVAYNYRRGEKFDLILEIGEDLLKNHIHELEKIQIKNLYLRIGSVYYQKKDLKKGAEYFKLSDKYSGGEDPRWY